MPYTPDTPQGSDTIASTTDPIRNNFGFLKDGLNVDHNFVDANPAAMYHKQVSMPAQGISPTLPAGTVGAYFIRNDAGNIEPYFYDGTNNWELNPWQRVLKGTWTPTSSNFEDVQTGILPNRIGMIFFYVEDAATARLSSMGTFYSTSAPQHIISYSTPQTYQASPKTRTDVELQNFFVGSTIRARINNPFLLGIAINYTILYRPA